MSVRWIGRAWLAACTVLAGCSGGGKVSETLADPDALLSKSEAIALIRFAPPDPACLALGMQIGVRDGDLYKPLQTLRLKDLAITNVMEVLLQPGEYHVLSLTCVRARSMQTMWEPQGDGRLRRSYSTFTVAAGEVVNLGEIKVVRADHKPGLWGNFIGVKVDVADWPLRELERFKSQRPKLFAEMRTRLMSVDGVAQPAADASQIKCAELRQLPAAGKVQSLPAACTRP